MRHKDKAPNFNPSELDYSQEANLFRQQLRERLLAAIEQSAALSDDDLDGLNAAGGYDVPPRRDSKDHD